jgi:hypothetical protein
MSKLSVRIRVIEANVPAMDILAGTSDPYCTIQIGYEYKWSSKIAKTKKISRTLHPIWNEVFDMQITNPDKERIKAIVFDHDMIGKDDAIGEANINLAQLPFGVEADMWVPLIHQTKPRGQLHLAVTAIGFGKPGGAAVVTTTTVSGGPMGAPGAYGAPMAQPGYGAPPMAQPGYGAPHGQPGYGAPPGQPGYGAPPMGQPGYPPQQGYGAPMGQPGYPAQPGYGAPPMGQPGYPAQPGYGAPPGAYGAPGGYPPQQQVVQQTTYHQQPVGYGAPPPVMVVQGHGHHGKHHKGYKFKKFKKLKMGGLKFKW